MNLCFIIYISIFLIIAVFQHVEFNRIYQSGMMMIYDLNQRSIGDFGPLT